MIVSSWVSDYDLFHETVAATDASRIQRWEELARIDRVDEVIVDVPTGLRGLPVHHEPAAFLVDDSHVSRLPGQFHRIAGGSRRVLCRVPQSQRHL